MGIEEDIQKVISFAKSHERVVAVYNGCDPEDGHEVYYLLTDKRGDVKFEDEISKLDYSLPFSLVCLPITIDFVKDSGFIQKVIWERAIA